MQTNWGIIQKAAEIVAKNTLRRGKYKSFELDDLTNEIIVFVADEASKEKSRFKRYITGEETNEKINKLAYSLTTEQKWLSGLKDKTIFNHNDKPNHNKEQIKKEVAKILREGPETEKEFMILDFMNAFLTDKQKRTLHLLYVEGLKPSKVAKVEGVHRTSIFDRHNFAIARVMKFEAPEYQTKQDHNLQAYKEEARW